jgi:ABC-type transport system involved in cytochrome c biogenesis permease subunit
MNGFSRFLPWLVGGAAVLYLAVAAAPATDPADGMHLQEFAVIPAVADGRVKPLDSVARTALTQVSNHQTFKDEDGKGNFGPEQPAIKWLLDAMVTNTKSPHDDRPGDRHPVFRVDNGDLELFLGLPHKPEFLRYSVEELAPRWQALAEKADAISHKPEKTRSLFEQKLYDLAEHLQIYMNLTEWKTPLIVPPQGEAKEWQSLKDGLADAEVFHVRNPELRKLLGLEDRPDGGRYSINDFAAHAGELDAAAQAASQRFRDKNKDFDALSDFDKSVLDLEFGLQSFLALKDAPVDKVVELKDPKHPATLALWKILNAYKKNDAQAFNAEVAAYRQWLDENRPADMRGAGFETFFNNFAPFFQCAVLYVLVFILTVMSWIVFTRPLNRAALALAVVTLVVHTFALGARMYILNRPFVFVINLYSTAIFIGWVCLIVGLVVERVFRVGIGLFVASVIGFLTMVIAHNLAAGDTLEMMRAVLDTNFWLATHVTSVNIGYAATMFTGVLGAAFILLGTLTTRLDRGLVKLLGDVTYGVLCFATLMSFIGTVLGGIWADQSWGRFWGWDPKENGALMIVIWNALVLHARWGGMVKQRGVAVLALFGNIVTIWSWFGVNLLGVGLHSYGFTKGVLFWVTTGIFIHLGLILVGGLVPLRFWRSYAAMQAPPPALPPAAPPPHAARGRRRRGEGGSTQFAPAT